MVSTCPAGPRAARSNLGGYQEARAHSERALALWRPDDGLPMRARLLMRLGFLTSHVGGGLQMWQLSARSRRHFEEAHALYEELGDTTSAALALAGAVWSREVTDVLDDLRRARDGLGPGAAPDAVCQVLCRLGDREFLVGQPRAALRTCAEGLALLEAQTGDEDPWYFPRRAQLHRSFGLTSAVATWWLGDAVSGRAAMLAIADEALSANDHLWAALAFHYLCRQSADWPPDAARYAERATVLAGERGLSSMIVWLAHLRAQAHVQQGEWEAAAALLDRAEVILGGMPDQPILPEGLGMVRGELARSDVGRSPSRSRRWSASCPIERRHGRIFKRVVRVCLARALLCGGEPARAHASLAPLIDRWERGEEGPFVLSALLPMALVEVADALGDADEAARWSAELTALGSGPRAGYARALAGFAAGSAGGRPAIEGAARAAEADGRRWEGAWMRLTGAESALRAGAVREAGEIAAGALEGFRAIDAEGWCRHCEALLRRLGHRVPGRRTPRGPGGLTSREREVLRLVVNGLSNRAIAERLVISQGTAGRHVSNVFSKLGAHSRLEAARIAAERGLLESADRA